MQFTQRDVLSKNAVNADVPPTPPTPASTVAEVNPDTSGDSDALETAVVVANGANAVALPANVTLDAAAEGVVWT